MRRMGGGVRSIVGGGGGGGGGSDLEKNRHTLSEPAPLSSLSPGRREVIERGGEGAQTGKHGSKLDASVASVLETSSDRPVYAEADKNDEALVASLRWFNWAAGPWACCADRTDTRTVSLLYIICIIR